MPTLVVAAAAATAGSYGAAYLTSIGASTFLATAGSAVIASAVAYGSSSLLIKQPSAPSMEDEAQGIATMTRSSVDSFKVIYGTRRVSGTIVFQETNENVPYKTSTGETQTATDKNVALHMVIVLAAHEVEEIGTIYLDDKPLTLDADGYATDSRWTTPAGTLAVRVKKHLGSISQTADTTLATEVDKWTLNHRLRGLAYVYVRLLVNPTTFPTGIPNISAIVKGKKVYDPRTDTTSFSNNWALCVRDYLTNTEYGLGATDAEVDDTSIIAAANVCEEAVTLQSGGTHARYTCDGVIDTEKTPIDVLNELNTAAAGIITYTGGRFAVFAGAYDTPTVDIDDTWLRGSMSISDSPGRKETFNAVKGIYVEPDLYYQPTDFSPITNTLYETEDGGERVWRDMELNFTTNQERAQRLAKVMLEQSRQSIVVQMECNLKAAQLRIWDTVRLTSALPGFSSKVFRVVGWQLNPDGGIDITLKEESSVAYDWNSGEPTLHDPAPDTNLPDAQFVLPPGVPTITETLIETIGGGGVKSKVVISWSPSPDAFAARYTVEYKKEGETTYTFAGETRDTSMTILDMEPSPYTFRIRATNTHGADSTFVTRDHTILGLSAPPADVQNFGLAVVNGQAHLTWDQVPDLDVKNAGRIRLRHSKSDSPSWSKGVDMTEALPGVATAFTAPLVAGTYMVKAVDSSNNESINATTITTDVPNILAMNFIEELDQGPSFAGNKTNMVATGGVLKLAGTRTWSEEDRTWSEIDETWTQVGGLATAGTYLFDGQVDLGAVLTCRLTADIEAQVVNALTKWSDINLTWSQVSQKWSGTEVSDVGLKLYVRTTKDDPSSSPTWSAWRRFMVADYTERAFEFKAEVVSTNTANNINITTLNVSVDMPDKTQSGNVSVGSGGASVSFPIAFKAAAPAIGITIQNGQSGDYPVISSVSGAGFNLTIKDSTDTAVARDVSYTAVGY